jgi:hypothetical protein
MTASKSAQSIGITAAWTLLLIVAQWLSIRFYFGWMDDIYFLNIIRGLFSAQAYPATEAMYGISNALVFLYQYAPNSNGYSILIVSLSWIGIFQWLYGLRLWTEGKMSWTSYFFVSLLIYVVLLAEYLLLLNFTRTAALLAGGSTFLLLSCCGKNTLRTPISLFASSMLFLGILMRWESALISSLCIVLCLGMNMRKQLADFLRNILKFLLIPWIAGVLCCIFFIQQLQTSDNARHDALRPHVSALLDHHGYAPLKWSEYPNDKIRTIALLSWFYQDQSQINQAFFERAYQANPELKSIGAGVFHKLKGEWKKIAQRKEVYGEGLRLNYKLSAGLVLWLILSMVKTHARNWLMTVSAVFALFILIAVFFKYEDRVFSPALAGMILVAFSRLTQFQSRKWLGFTIMLLLPLGILRGEMLHKMALEKAEEIRLKQEWKSEINHLKDIKIFMFDLYSMSLNPDLPFDESRVPKDQTWTVFGDMHYGETGSHNLYLKSLFGTYKNHKEFYQRAAQRQDVLFLMPDFRIRILNTYLWKLWDSPYEFRKIDEPHGLDHIRWSYVWTPVQFHYCRLVQHSGNRTAGLYLTD